MRYTEEQLRAVLLHFCETKMQNAIKQLAKERRAKKRAANNKKEGSYVRKSSSSAS